MTNVWCSHDECVEVTWWVCGVHMMSVWRSHDECVEGGGHMMSVWRVEVTWRMCGGHMMSVWRSHDECVEGGGHVTFVFPFWQTLYSSWDSKVPVRFLCVWLVSVWPVEVEGEEVRIHVKKRNHTVPLWVLLILCTYSTKLVIPLSHYIYSLLSAPLLTSLSFSYFCFCSHFE